MNDTTDTRKAAVDRLDETLQDILGRLGEATEQLNDLTAYGEGWHPAYDQYTNTDDAFEYLRNGRMQIQALLMFHRHVTGDFPQAAASAREA